MNYFSVPLATTPLEAIQEAQNVLDTKVFPSVEWGATTAPILFSCFMFASFVGWFLRKM
jgi:hypothetical protein